MTVLIVVLSLIAALLIASFIFANAVFNICFKRAKNPEDNIEKNIRLIEKAAVTATRFAKAEIGCFRRKQSTTI